MNKSDSIAKLTTALVAAQAQLKPAIKDSKNPFFKSNYADLQAVWDACRAALHGNGLSVTQIASSLTNGDPALETLLVHISGEWISGLYPLSPSKKDPQGVGAALTYARRYALAAMVGVVYDDDDDGESTASRAKITTKGDVKTKKPSYTDEQKKEAGEIRAAMMPLHNGDAQFSALYKKMAYDEPSDFIDAARNLLKQCQDIASQAEGPQ